MAGKSVLGRYGPNSVFTKPRAEKMCPREKKKTSQGKCSKIWLHVIFFNFNIVFVWLLKNLWLEEPDQFISTALAFSEPVFLFFLLQLIPWKRSNVWSPKIGIIWEVRPLQSLYIWNYLNGGCPFFFFGESGPVLVLNNFWKENIKDGGTTKSIKIHVWASKLFPNEIPDGTCNGGAWLTHHPWMMRYEHTLAGTSSGKHRCYVSGAWSMKKDPLNVCIRHVCVCVCAYLCFFFWHSNVNPPRWITFYSSGSMFVNGILHWYQTLVWLG